MRKNLFPSLAAGLAIAACARTAMTPAQSGPARGAVVVPSFDPVGDFEFTFTDDGKPLRGTMTVRGTPGDYTGRIRAETRPEVAISTVTASGPQVTVTGDVPGGVLLLRFRVSGDSLLGDWSLKGQGGRIVGRHSPVTVTP